MKLKYNIILLLSIISSSLIASNLEFNSNFYKILNDDSNWNFHSLNSQYTIYTKAIKGKDILAVRVNTINNITPNIIQEIVYDLASYPITLKKSPGLISKEIFIDENRKIGYQYIAIDIPFFSDRHYLFDIRTNPIKNLELPIIQWKLIENDTKYSKNMKNCNDCTYLKSGFGLWKASKVDGKRYEYSYRLFMDPGGSIPDFLIDQINFTSIENIFSDVMEEGSARSK